MKKTVLFIVSAFLISFSASSQTYGFLKTTGTYTNLTNTTSVNNGQIWDDPNYSFPTSFTYQLFGNTYDSIFMGVGLGGYLIPSKDLSAIPMPLILLTSADLVDRGELSLNNLSISPISFTTIGTSGNRIFKLEYRNAGFYNDIFTNQGVSTDFINMQVWIYESSGNIEYHFGPNNVTQPIISYDGLGPSHGLSPNLNVNSSDLSNNSILLTGLANSPSAVIDSTYLRVDGTPANGTIYRFVNGGAVSVLEFTKSDKLSFGVFPNPAITNITLDIEQKELISNVVSIYSVNGNLIGIKGFEKNINVSDLNSGTYFLEVLTEQGRAIAKFVKK